MCTCDGSLPLNPFWYSLWNVFTKAFLRKYSLSLHEIVVCYKLENVFLTVSMHSNTEEVLVTYGFLLIIFTFCSEAVALQVT